MEEEYRIYVDDQGATIVRMPYRWLRTPLWVLLSSVLFLILFGIGILLTQIWLWVLSFLFGFTMFLIGAVLFSQRVRCPLCTTSLPASFGLEHAGVTKYCPHCGTEIQLIE